MDGPGKIDLFVGSEPAHPNSPIGEDCLYSEMVDYCVRRLSLRLLFHQVPGGVSTGNCFAAS